MNWLAWSIGFIVIWALFFFLVQWYINRRDERLEREEQENKQETTE